MIKLAVESLLQTVAGLATSEVGQQSLQERLDASLNEEAAATGISKELRTSNSYESLINAISKYKVSNTNRIILAAVGIPYGLFEMIRISSKDLNLINFNLNISIRRATDTSAFEAKKKFIVTPTKRIFIDYTSGKTYTDITSINMLEVSKLSRETGDIITTAATVEPDMQLHSLGEAYFEEVLGIYPRIAFKKQNPVGKLPELQFASQAVENLKFKEDEAALLKSRYRAAIMHHTLFNSSKLIRDIDSSFAFDAIAYVLIDIDDLGIATNDVLQITANIEAA